MTTKIQQTELSDNINAKLNVMEEVPNKLNDIQTGITGLGENINTSNSALQSSIESINSNLSQLPATMPSGLIDYREYKNPFRISGRSTYSASETSDYNISLPTKTTSPTLVFELNGEGYLNHLHYYYSTAGTDATTHYFEIVIDDITMFKYEGYVKPSYMLMGLINPNMYMVKGNTSNVYVETATSGLHHTIHQDSQFPKEAPTIFLTNPIKFNKSVKVYYRLTQDYTHGYIVGSGVMK